MFRVHWLTSHYSLGLILFDCLSFQTKLRTTSDGLHRQGRRTFRTGRHDPDISSILTPYLRSPFRKTQAYDDADQSRKYANLQNTLLSFWPLTSALSTLSATTRKDSNDVPLTSATA